MVMPRADPRARRATGSQHQRTCGQQNEQQVFHKHLLSVSHAGVMLRGSSLSCFSIA
jgi:hypothetical protein